jgi:hypothetical protein
MLNSNMNGGSEQAKLLKWRMGNRKKETCFDLGRQFESEKTLKKREDQKGEWTSCTDLNRQPADYNPEA